MGYLQYIVFCGIMDRRLSRRQHMHKFLSVSRWLPVIPLLALTLLTVRCSGVSDQIKAALDTPVASLAPPVTKQAVEPPPTKVLPVAPLVGARAPEFKLYDLESVELALSDFRGRPVLLNFWATW
jgi:hypothetical protein